MLTHRSEGAYPAMGIGKAESLHHCNPKMTSAKIHGCQPQVDSGRSGNTLTHNLSIKKRSLRRAQKRLLLYGHTWYRGQLWMQEVQYSPPIIFFDSYVHKSQFQPPEHRPQNRLVIWHWNAGQLSPSRYQELLRYLHHQQVDVAVLSETHWHYSNEWATPLWHAIHTGADSDHSYDKASGILILVAKRVCHAHQLSWNAVVPGRILHCRLHLESKPFDLVGVYQYPWNTILAQRKRRQTIWKHLRHTLQAIPQRNFLCLIGDFNCSLPQIARLVGTSTFWNLQGRRPGPQHGDMADFACILQDFQLTALNSWLPQHGATFHSTVGESRIDFILTRFRDADTTAKNVGYIEQAPFLNDTAHHVPLLTSVSYKFQRPKRAHHGLPRQAKQKCLEACRQDTLTWQRCVNDIDFTLRGKQRDVTLSDIYDIMMEGTKHYFGSSSPIESDAYTSHVATKWMHYKMMKAFSHPVLRHVFQKWWHFIKFSQLDRAQAKVAKIIKLQKIQQLTDEAQVAYAHHDSFWLYRVINKLCPKQRMKRVHLKGDDGRFMTPTEETAAYVHYVASNWCGPQLTLPSFPPPGIPFDVDELQHAIEKIPATKAVPHCFPPGPMWKSQAHFLANWLFEQLECWWSISPPFIPQAWKDAWACWLPKPNKPATKMESLRMLGLQEPLGKAVLQLITSKALTSCFQTLCRWPQYAYLPCRSTRDALLRAASHCQAVRTLLSSQSRSVHQSTASQPRLSCAGGIQLCLDLTRAFDAVPRPVIAAALEKVQLSPQLQCLLLSWHLDTKYHLDINQTVRSVEVTRGVRQGCSSAPLLWTTVMVLLLDRLQDTIPLTWIQNNITIYADDLHVFCTFHSDIELRDACKYIDAVVHTIETLGLSLSAQKSCIILRGKGAGFHKWKQTHVKKTSRHNQYIEFGQGKHCIPIRKQCLYLGTVLSYDDFQKQTVALRVQAGWKNFRRLQSWLCKKYKIPISMRLQLFNTCIIPTICYGIFFTGLTSTCVDLLLKTFHMMYRRVLGHVPHLTGINTVSALDFHNVRYPLLTLHQLVEQAHLGLCSALNRVPSDDIIHLTDWSSLDSTRALLEQKLVQPEPILVPQDEVPPLVCGFCSFTTESTAEMQKHHTTVHSKPTCADSQIDFAKDTIDGKPWCKHCNKIFTHWSSFKTHRRYNMCNVPNTSLDRTHTSCDSDFLRGFQETPPDQMEISNAHADLLGRAQVFAAEADYDSVMNDRPLCDFMKTHCILCSKHVVSLRSLTSHLRANHPGQMQEAIALGIQRTRQYTGNMSPCRFCDTEFKQTHLCPVTTQVAVLEMQTTSADDPRHFTCFLCQFVAPDRLQLRQHLSTRHQFPCFDWTPARDCLPDQ